MGKVFEMDWEPTFGKELQLTNFSQLLTTSSGRVEVRSGLAMSMFQFQMLKNDEEEELESQVHCWEPTKRLLVPTISMFTYQHLYNSGRWREYQSCVLV